MKLKIGDYTRILDGLYEGAYIVDLKKKIHYWNDSAEKITGFKKSEVVGECCADDILVHMDEKGRNYCVRSCPLDSVMRKRKSEEHELYLKHKNGYRIPVSVKIIPIYDSKRGITGAFEIFKDNSKTETFAEKINSLEKVALIDSLTGIPNRRYIEMNITARLNEMSRFGWKFGLLFIDIDNFKKVNDTYGHENGDNVLKMVANTISRNSRANDIIGRWGGEEFICLVVNVNKKQIYSVAEKFRMLIEQSGVTVKGGNLVRVTISVGGTIVKLNDDDKSLIERADSFMYESKKSGKNLVTIG